MLAIFFFFEENPAIFNIYFFIILRNHFTIILKLSKTLMSGTFCVFFAAKITKLEIYQFLCFITKNQMCRDKIRMPKSIKEITTMSKCVEKTGKAPLNCIVPRIYSKGYNNYAP